MTKSKRYSSVVEAIRDIPEMESYADSLDRRIQGRQLIKLLVTLRALRGKSQGDIAASVGCTQSRISKLESGVDGDLRLSDLAEYLNAIGVTPQLVLFQDPATLVERVKFHFRETTRLLGEMIELAGNDPALAEGTRKFFHEAGLNYVNLVSKTIEQRALQAQRMPWLTIADDAETSDPERRADRVPESAAGRTMSAT